jgi:hypothetical protein
VNTRSTPNSRPTSISLKARFGAWSGRSPANRPSLRGD